MRTYYSGVWGQTGMPLLFLMVLDIMMTKAMNRKKVVQWGLYDKLEHLDFADGICTVAQF
jgi:hypothetical protein